MRKTARRILLVFLAALLLFPSAAGAGGRYQLQFFDLFDTFSQITVAAEDKLLAQQITDAAYGELKYCHQLFDAYHSYEGVPNLKTINDQAGIAPVRVDRRLYDLIAFGKELYTLTGGRVNMAMGSVLHLWHQSRLAGLEDPANAALPDAYALQSAAALTDMDQVILDPEKCTVYLALPGMRLDVGAIGKGYAVELAARLVQPMGAQGVLFNVGGNIRALGTREDGTPWVTGVQDPLNPAELLLTMPLNNMSLVSSGDYQRYYTVDGVKYHHLIDPDTLMPAGYYHQVTVLCEDSGLADGLSTALFLMPLEQGQRLLESIPGAEALWVLPGGELVKSAGLE